MGYELEKCQEVSVIIAVCNGLPDTKRCVEALRWSLSGESYEIIVIDNGSQDGTYRWISVQPDIKAIRNDENHGMAFAWNQGMRISRGATILFLHNDVIIGRSAFLKMKETLESRPDIGVTGTFANCDIGEYHPEGQYPSLDDIERVASKVERDHGRETPKFLLGSYCLMGKRDVVMAVDGFDESFRYAGDKYGDIDFSFRVLQAGYFPVQVSTYVHHETSVSDKGELRGSDRAIFWEKWKIRPEYSLHTRENLVDYIDKMKPGLCVLDIGCACGGNLMWLKYHNPQAKLYGIELDPSAARIAGQFGHVEAQDVEFLERDEWMEKFDYIIMGDVLEHLRDPWKTLRVMASLLKADGKIIACVPNVGHISNVWELLNGNWRYQDMGILDRTHLRFFTRRSFESGLQGTGLYCCDCRYVAAGFSEDMEQKFGALAKGLRALEGVDISEEDLSAYQWIFLLAKKS